MTRKIWTQFSATYDNKDIDQSIEAPIHDPLWLLTRQWQMGEFQGEDAGSPVRVVIDHDAFKIDRIQIDDQTERSYDPRQAPLEMVIERETAQQVRPDLRTRAQQGLLLWQQLTQENLPFDRNAMRDLFGFAPEAELSHPDLGAGLLIQKALDADQLYRRLRTTPLEDADVVEIFGLDDSTEPSRYRLIAETWVESYEASMGQPDQVEAWREDRLEYRFRLSVPTDKGRVSLQAEEYPGGRLDWDSFDVPAVTAPSADDPAGEPIHSRQTLLPSPVTYLGMPAPRFWEFENGAVDFGNPDAADRDLGRLLLAEFVMAWGNDWFQVPVEVPRGSLCRVNELLVTDTFGVTNRILSQAYHSPYWGMNYLRQHRNKNIVNLKDFLFVPPVLPNAHQAQPLEEIRFRRDEMANLTWAIEHTVADAMGRPQHLADQQAKPASTLTQLNRRNGLTYQAMTNLPEHWIPLVTSKTPDNQHRFFVRPGLLDELQAEAPAPAGQILSQDHRFRVHEEEIPYEGLQVERAYQLTCWYNGHRILWVGRRKRTGQGAIRSHLEFDTLTS